MYTHALVEMEVVQPHKTTTKTEKINKRIESYTRVCSTQVWVASMQASDTHLCERDCLGGGGCSEIPVTLRYLKNINAIGITIPYTVCPRTITLQRLTVPFFVESYFLSAAT